MESRTLSYSGSTYNSSYITYWPSIHSLNSEGSDWGNTQYTNHDSSSNSGSHIGVYCKKYEGVRVWTLFEWTECSDSG